MKELEKNELMGVDGGGGLLGALWAVAEAVHDIVTGEGLIGEISTRANYYRAQMPSNWTGHGY